MRLHVGHVLGVKAQGSAVLETRDCQFSDIRGFGMALNGEIDVFPKRAKVTATQVAGHPAELADATFGLEGCLFGQCDQCGMFFSKLGLREEDGPHFGLFACGEAIGLMITNCLFVSNDAGAQDGCELEVDERKCMANAFGVELRGKAVASLSKCSFETIAGAGACATRETRGNETKCILAGNGSGLKAEDDGTAMT